jgi:ribonuclease HI
MDKKRPVDWYYAVLKGYVPGIYSSWPSASDQVNGFTGAKYKKFKSRTEAEYYMDTAGKTIESKTVMLNRILAEKKTKPAKPLVISNLKSTVKPLPPPPPSSPPSPSSTTTTLSPKRIVNVFTDGSSIRNGKPDCQAGYGVYFSPNNSLNVSGPMVGILGELEPPSNQKAELKAIQVALEIVCKMSDIGELYIYSDSKYSIQCATTWIKSWKKNGWKTASGGNVKHKKIISGISDTLDTLKAKGTSVKFIHINSHQKAPADKSSREYFIWHGNEMADRLASQGSKMAQSLSKTSCNVSLIKRVARP